MNIGKDQEFALLETSSAVASAAGARIACGLHHVSDAEPGIRRLRCGRGFRYVGPGGAAVSAQEKARIAALAIPPAWSEVWICPDALGYLQATGRDARGRKQYRYHPAWTAMQAETKFAGLPDFARALSRLRRTVDADLRRHRLGREKVVATVVSLMDRLLIRVGNEGYARDNKSFGITTLRNRHLKAEGAKLRFVFTGKSGKTWNIATTDRRIARIVRTVQELPGQQLFQYIDEHGDRRPVTSQDINDYLRMAMKADFTSRHFRTWAATVSALEALRSIEPPQSEAARQRELNRQIDRVARALGNTRAVCRGSYIHPGVLDHWRQGRLASQLADAAHLRVTAPRLNEAERRTLKWLLFIGTRQGDGEAMGSGTP